MICCTSLFCVNSYNEISGFVELQNEEGSLVKGIWFEEEYKRVYPGNTLACDVIGFTTSDNQGKYGLEEYYNDELKGKSGYITYERDKYGYKIANGREYTEPADNGDDVYLTIDNKVYCLRKEIKKRLFENKII